MAGLLRHAWLREWLYRIYEFDGVFPRHPLQVIGFRNFAPASSIIAEISDGTDFILVGFTDDCVDQFQSQYYGRITQHRGSLVQIRSARLIMADAEGLLLVDKLLYVGGTMHMAQIGQPTFFALRLPNNDAMHEEEEFLSQEAAQKSRESSPTSQRFSTQAVQPAAPTAVSQAVAAAVAAALPATLPAASPRPSKRQKTEDIRPAHSHPGWRQRILAKEDSWFRVPAPEDHKKNGTTPKKPSHKKALEPTDLPRAPEDHMKEGKIPQKAARKKGWGPLDLPPDTPEKSIHSVLGAESPANHLEPHPSAKSTPSTAMTWEDSQDTPSKTKVKSVNISFQTSPKGKHGHGKSSEATPSIPKGTLKNLDGVSTEKKVEISLTFEEGSRNILDQVQNLFEKHGTLQPQDPASSSTTKRGFPSLPIPADKDEAQSQQSLSAPTSSAPQTKSFGSPKNVEMPASRSSGASAPSAPIVILSDSDSLDTESPSVVKATMSHPATAAANGNSLASDPKVYGNIESEYHTARLEMRKSNFRPEQSAGESYGMIKSNSQHRSSNILVPHFTARELAMSGRKSIQSYLNDQLQKMKMERKEDDSDGSFELSINTNDYKNVRNGKRGISQPAGTSDVVSAVASKQLNDGVNPSNAFARLAETWRTELSRRTISS